MYSATPGAPAALVEQGAGATPGDVEKMVRGSFVARDNAHWPSLLLPSTDHPWHYWFGSVAYTKEHYGSEAIPDHLDGLAVERLDEFGNRKPGAPIYYKVRSSTPGAPEQKPVTKPM